MKRIAGAWMLLAGLSGCISFQSGADPVAKPDTKAPASAAGGPPGSVPPPTYPSWAPNGATPAVQPAVVPGARPVGLTNTMPPIPGSPAPLPAGLVEAAPGKGLPPSIIPMVTTAKPAAPAVNTVLTPVPAPAVVIAPVTSPVPLTRAEGPQIVTQTGFVPTPESPQGPALEHPPEPTIVSSGEVSGGRGFNLKPVPAPATPEVAVVKAEAKPEAKPEAGPEPKAAKAPPMLRFVNTKRITLNFEVKDVGPSGLAAVELWYTQDCKEWKKYDAPTKAHSYILEVDEEGMYGFTLVARSGAGLAKEAPVSGDQPQVWVIVDQMKPAMQMLDPVPTATGKGQAVAIRWQASDKNLARQPITLTYAEKEEGPWKPIAGNLANTGSYVWQCPPGLPGKFLIRAEAIDLAGNVGVTTKGPVILDAATPKVSILAVESTSGQ